MAGDLVGEGNRRVDSRVCTSTSAISVMIKIGYLSALSCKLASRRLISRSLMGAMGSMMRKMSPSRAAQKSVL